MGEGDEEGEEEEEEEEEEGAKCGFVLPFDKVGFVPPPLFEMEYFPCAEAVGLCRLEWVGDGGRDAPSSPIPIPVPALSITMSPFISEFTDTDIDGDRRGT